MREKFKWYFSAITNFGQIYEEYAMGLKSEDWIELYRYATEEDHSFMFINFQKPKRLRMMKNFTDYLFIEDK